MRVSPVGGGNTADMLLKGFFNQPLEVLSLPVREQL
jgi:hypothetical protein